MSYQFKIIVIKTIIISDYYQHKIKKLKKLLQILNLF